GAPNLFSRLLRGLFRRSRRRLRLAPARSGGVGAADHHPALALRDRTTFLDPHRITGAVAVVLIVRRVFFRARHEFLVDRVHEAALDADYDRLVAGVADDHPLENASWHISYEPLVGDARREWF